MVGGVAPGDQQPLTHDRSHAQRGNAAQDTLRSLLNRDAERHRRRSHAERGDEHADDSQGW